MNHFDSKLIKYTPKPKYIEISYNDQELNFEYKSLLVPFGVEKYFSNYILKIILNSESEELFKIIRKIEQENIMYLKKEGNFSESDYKSQIIHKDNYGDFLVVKIPSVKGQITTHVVDSENNIDNIFNVKKKQKINICLELNTIWNFKNKYSCVPKATKIKIL